MRNLTKSSILASGLALVLLSGLRGFAQPPTTIQLPTFDSFSISTSVLVPDRGSMILGGVDRSAYGSVTNGVPGLSHLPYAGRLFQNRAIGHEASSSTASVSAYIHDLQAMDEQLLAEAAANRAGDDRAGDNRAGNDRAGPSYAGRNAAAVTQPWEAKAAQLTRALESSRSTASATPVRRTGDDDTSASGHPVASVAEIRRQATVEAQRRESEALDFIAQGRDAELAGKPQVAKLFYQMAVRRSNADAGRSAQSHLARLAASSSPTRNASQLTSTPHAARSR